MVVHKSKYFMLFFLNHSLRLAAELRASFGQHIGIFELPVNLEGDLQSLLQVSFFVQHKHDSAGDISVCHEHVIL